MKGSKCDRCGSEQDPIPRGYGFGKVGYNLCRFCALKWEKLIRSEGRRRRWKVYRSGRKTYIVDKRYDEFANKLLTEFVTRVDEPERVEFT